MGIAPLSAYGVTSVRRLGRGIVYPLVFTAFVLLLLYVTGTQHGGALLGYGVVFLAGFVALWEIWRAAEARSRARKEPVLAAMWALFSRNRRRYGGYIVHVGVTVIGIGVIGSTVFQAQTERLIRQGETLDLQDYQLRYDGITLGTADDNREMVIADVTVLRDGQEITRLRPRLDDFDGMTMSIAGTHSTLENDVYVLLNDYREDINAVRLWFYINPLVNLIWWGGLILIAGTLLTSWTGEGGEKRREPAKADPSLPTREGVMA
jgi:cytochrome c-type biogenesis protein CcmF